MIREMNKKSRWQTFLSIVILSILMIIGAGIFIAQFRYNPAVLQKDALLQEPDKDKPFSRLPTAPSFIPLPEGIQPLTATQIFDTRNLSDKINGKAELYLSAGFTRLVSQRFWDERAADLWMEVFVYDMENYQNAFSVFSAQRREDAEPLGIAQYAYRTSNALFLIHGRYYVEIITSQESEQILEHVRIMAETFIRNTPFETITINEKELFPEQGLVRNSIALIAANAFGYEGFDKIYTAQYEFDGQNIMAYLSLRQAPAKAEELALAYTQFLITYGGKAVETELPIKNARWIEILDVYEIVFSHESYLAGIREAASIDQAKMLATRLYHRIKEVGHESQTK